MSRLPALLLAALLAACSATKQLDAHYARLLAATAADVPLAEKRDALGTSAVEAMTQAVNRLNPKDGVKYIQAYAEANGPLLDTLAAQLRRGTAAMPRAERAEFALKTASQPYAREAAQLLPKFIAKYRQVQAMSRITGNLNAALLGGAAGELGRLLGRVGVRDAGRALDGGRQLDGEGGPGGGVGVGREGDPPAEALDGLLGDREPDARAGVAPLGVEHLEQHEHLVGVGGVDPDAVVAHA